MNKEKGQVLLLTVVMLTGVILSTTSLVALLVLYQLRQTGDILASNQAIFAADAGIECALYKKFKESKSNEMKESKSNEMIASECSALTFGNGAQVKVVVDDQLIKSAGRSRQSARAFEASF